MFPHLPAAQVRAAVDSGDWPLATDLLTEHQRALAQALSAIDLSTMPHEPWRHLLQAQQMLLDELRIARDKVEVALSRLTHDHRGARAWLRELA